MDDPTFPFRYAEMPDVEAVQGKFLRRHLSEFWLAHHDDYAPNEKKASLEDSGGNAKVVALIQGHNKAALDAMQKAMDLYHPN